MTASFDLPVTVAPYRAVRNFNNTKPWYLKEVLELAQARMTSRLPKAIELYDAAHK